MPILKLQKLQEEIAKTDGRSIISVVNYLLIYAQAIGSSDVHLSPCRAGVSVRLRVDGVLQDAIVLPVEIHSEVISRIKVLARLRTDEHHSAQDGRFSVTFEGHSVDVRVSIIPTYYGENAVMRLLSERVESVSLDTLGFAIDDRKKVESASKNPYGMILATGPTGSGKTTTLYTLLNKLNTKEASIITVEDPIEYSIDGINQIQVITKTGLTFANGLRSILRQDPNIIMVGEIRDKETAGLAVNTALTGHLVFSTLHTNDAATTLPRLLDLGLEPYLIAATVNLVIGQRLVRTICLKCKIKYDLSDTEIKSLSGVNSVVNFGHNTFYKGTGCESCNGFGYRGRTGIYEVIVVDDLIRESMLNRRSASEIKIVARQNGMKSMAEDGFRKALEGVTTIEEVLRVIHE